MPTTLHHQSVVGQSKQIKFITNVKIKGMSTLKNKVNLIGRLGAKPEIQQFDSGVKKTRLSIATNENYKDKKGEWVENTQWHTVVAWGKLCDRIEKVLDKGSEVVLEGKLVNRSYESKSGEKRFATEIEMSEFVVLTLKK
jgi:single-strand DNA-binding protein